jgi:hypothetical protein
VSIVEVLTYLAVGVPKMTYALDTWYTPPHKPPGKKRNSGSVKATKLMTHVQQLATIAITGALKSTSTDAQPLDAHSGIPPTPILLQYIYERSTIRMATIQKPHPIHSIITRHGSLQLLPRPNESPLSQMFRLAKIDPNKVEKIIPPHRSPEYTPPFETEVAESREDSIENEAEDKSAIQIYTDGSGIDGKVGGAAVMYKGEQEEPHQTLRYHRGSTQEHSTYEAEAVGVVPRHFDSGAIYLRPQVPSTCPGIQPARVWAARA